MGGMDGKSSIERGSGKGRHRKGRGGPGRVTVQNGQTKGSQQDIRWSGEADKGKGV